jgi:hypothetical protein
MGVNWPRCFELAAHIAVLCQAPTQNQTIDGVYHLGQTKSRLDCEH